MDSNSFVSEIESRKIDFRVEPGPLKNDVSLFRRQVNGVILPASQEEVFEVVRIAGQHGVSLHPISGGKNWGYGTALPAQDSVWILDLSRLNRIIGIDLEQMAITIEPGVTQSQLHQYLEENEFDAMTPNTGIGAHGNILGNILERGFGVAPLQDHASSLMSLKACMANGKEFQSFFRGLSGDIGNGYKWGIGPSLEPLFLQSNFAVITEATIKLTKRPEQIELAVFSVKNSAQLQAAVDAGRHLNLSLPGQVNAFKIFDSMQVKNTIDSRSERLFGVQIGASRICIAVLYSNRDQIGTLRKAAKRIIRKHGFSDLNFFSRRGINRLNGFLDMWPLKGMFHQHRRALKSLSEYMRLAEGYPSSIGLNILYPNLESQLLASVDPVKDGKTIIWYAPITPMKGENLAKVIGRIGELTSKAGLPRPSMTITCVSETTAAITVPLLFKPVEREAVYDLYRELLKVGAKEGFFPYRVPIEFIKDLVQFHPQYWAQIKVVKEALDPKNSIAPGRYSDF